MRDPPDTSDAGQQAGPVLNVPDGPVRPAKERPRGAEDVGPVLAAANFHAAGLAQDRLRARRPAPVVPAVHHRLRHHGRQPGHASHPRAQEVKQQIPDHDHARKKPNHLHDLACF